MRSKCALGAGWSRMAVAALVAGSLVAAGCGRADGGGTVVSEAPLDDAAVAATGEGTHAAQPEPPHQPDDRPVGQSDGGPAVVPAPDMPAVDAGLAAPALAGPALTEASPDRLAAPAGIEGPTAAAAAASATVPIHGNATATPSGPASSTDHAPSVEVDGGEAGSETEPAATGRLDTSPPGPADCRDLLRAVLVDDHYPEAGTVGSTSADLDAALDEMGANGPAAAARSDDANGSLAARQEHPGEAGLFTAASVSVEDCMQGIAPITGEPAPAEPPAEADTGGRCAVLLDIFAGPVEAAESFSPGTCWEIVADLVADSMIDAGLAPRKAACVAPIYLQAYQLVLEGAAAGSFDNALLDRLADTETAMREGCGLGDPDLHALARIAPDTGMLG